MGYTIATFISTVGFSKGLIFIFISVLLQNLIFIPVILALGVSGFKLYKSIIKDKRKENIKLEIIRHTIFSILMTFLLIVSSLVETLTLEEYKELKSMLITAIGTMEEMRRKIYIDMGIELTGEKIFKTLKGSDKE